MSDSPDLPSGPAPPWRPKYNPWLIGVVVAMAAFMVATAKGAWSGPRAVDHDEVLAAEHRGKRRA